MITRKIIFVSLGLLAPTLGAQSTSVSAPAMKERPDAISFGYVATLGAHWQMEGVEIGYARRLQRGLAAVSLAGRVATFMNESAMLGGTRGFVFAATLSARTRMRSIAAVGENERGTSMGFDVTFEITGYAAARSPLWQGSRWAAVSVLPAISLGTGDAPHFAIMIGPTAFLGSGKPSVRGMLALRVEAPVPRRERP